MRPVELRVCSSARAVCRGWCSPTSRRGKGSGRRDSPPSSPSGRNGTSPAFMARMKGAALLHADLDGHPEHLAELIGEIDRPRCGWSGSRESVNGGRPAPRPGKPASASSWARAVRVVGDRRDVGVCSRRRPGSSGRLSGSARAAETGRCPSPRGRSRCRRPRATRLSRNGALEILVHAEVVDLRGRTAGAAARAGAASTQHAAARYRSAARRCRDRSPGTSRSPVSSLGTIRNSTPVDARARHPQ